MLHAKGHSTERDVPSRTRSRPQSLGEGVYLQLKQDIFDFRLLPGDHFTEGEIATRLKVSRTPVREALFRLEKEGYLQVHYRSGWSVRDAGLQAVRQPVRPAHHSGDCRGQPALRPRRTSATRPPQGHLAGSGRRAHHGSRRSGAVGRRLSIHPWSKRPGNPEVLRCHREVTERIRILRRLDFTEAGRITATYQEHGQILRTILRRRADAGSHAPACPHRDQQSRSAQDFLA